MILLTFDILAQGKIHYIADILTTKDNTIATFADDISVMASSEP